MNGNRVDRGRQEVQGVIMISDALGKYKDRGFSYGQGILEVRSLRNMRKIISDWKCVVMDTFWSIKNFSRNTMDFLTSQNYISIKLYQYFSFIMSVNIGSKTQDLLLFNQTQKINLSIKKSVICAKHSNLSTVATLEISDLNCRQYYGYSLYADQRVFFIGKNPAISNVIFK